jgi:hypothetical protein
MKTTFTTMIGFALAWGFALCALLAYFDVLTK